VSELLPTKLSSQSSAKFQLGTFFIFKKLLFEDSSFKDKLFIVLGQDGNNFLAAITTSKEKPPFRTRNPGFNDAGSSFFVAQARKVLESGRGFDLDTWVDFSRLYPANSGRLEAHMDAKVIHILGKVDRAFLVELMDAALQSDDLSGTEIAVIKQSKQGLSDET
jgi:hypothetical protein